MQYGDEYIDETFAMRVWLRELDVTYWYVRSVRRICWRVLSHCKRMERRNQKRAVEAMRRKCM